MAPAQVIPPISHDLVEKVKEGKCILFLGAGAHHPPKKTDPVYAGTYPAHQQPPIGEDLAKIVADKSDLATDAGYSPKEKAAIAGDLKRISLYYELTQGRKALVSLVKKAVSDNKEPSRALKALADLNFPIICTTNYDSLFDKALFLAGKTPVVSSYSNDRFSLTRDYQDDITPPVKNPFLFKIHGDIDDPTQSIVITDEDYIHFILRMITGNGQSNPIPTVLGSHLPYWPMLFIGFSLMDYDLRLLFQLLGWRFPNPRFSYSVGPYPDGLIRKRYNPPVQFIVNDVWSFVPDLYLAVTGKAMP